MFTPCVWVSGRMNEYEMNFRGSVRKMTCIATPNAPTEPHGSHKRTGASTTAPCAEITTSHSRGSRVTGNAHRHDKTRRCAGVSRPRPIGSMHPFVSGHRLLHHGAKNERMPLIHAEWQPLDTQAHGTHSASARTAGAHQRIRGVRTPSACSTSASCAVQRSAAN